MNLPNAAFHPGFGGADRSQEQGAATADGEVAWFLSGEVFRSLDQMVASVDDCIESLPRPARSDCPAPQDRFVMQQSSGQGGSGADTAKCVLVMEGPALVQAELQVKIHKHPNTIHKTSILPDAPWLLVQLQDAANMLTEARRCADDAGQLRAQVKERVRAETLDADFLRCLTARLSHSVEELMRRLRRAQDALLSPRKRTIQDHLSSENMKSLRPALPGDIAVSFYVQGHRLILAVYHLVPQRGSLHFDMFLAECCLPRLEAVLDGLTRTFQMGQELRRKLQWAVRFNRSRRPAQPPAPARLQNGV